MMYPRSSRAALLRDAAKFSTSCCKSWQRVWSGSRDSEKTAYRIRFDFPGVLKVFCAKTGAQMSQSEAGKPTVPDGEGFDTLLYDAAGFAASCAIRWQKVWRPSLSDWRKVYLVRFDYPGILRVYCGNSGELLAESAPGQPDQLSC